MTNKLPKRPNLDHLRRQAKALLAALSSGDKEAIKTIRQHLPAARNLNDEQVLKAGFRLADAQSAIARKTGFASWPQLARHVEQLRALEGTWDIATLEMDGRTMPAAMLKNSRVLIDGDCFRSETPGATYEGVFNIDVESDPHGIDIDFVEGPEAGNRNCGIYRLEGDRLSICLDTTGKGRPTAFGTVPGTGHAFETLQRTSVAQPESVTGGSALSTDNSASTPSSAGFEYVPTETLARLQGEWVATTVVKDGQDLPAFMCASGRRTAVNNEVKVFFGGQLMIHALVRIDETKTPIHVDYLNLAGPTKGAIQHGVMKWSGNDACFCIASAGEPRPTDFDCPAGSGRTLSTWRAAKKT